MMQSKAILGGWGYANCLKLKAELPLEGGLAFLNGKGGGEK